MNIARQNQKLTVIGNPYWIAMGASSVLYIEKDERRAYFGTSMISGKAHSVCCIYVWMISFALVPKNWQV